MPYLWLLRYWKYLAGAVLLAALWYAWHQHYQSGYEAGEGKVQSQWDAATKAAQARKTAQEAQDKLDKEKQDGQDSDAVAALKRQVADLLAKPARVIRVRDTASRDLPPAEANAGAGQTTCPASVDGGPDDRPVERASLIEYAKTSETLRLQVMSCQAQWPK